MKPKNTKERRTSFLKFLLMFVITTGLVLATFYFNYKIPVQENENLRVQVKRTEKERVLQNDFYKDMVVINTYMDSLSNGLLDPDREDYIQVLVDKRLSKLISKVPDKDSTNNAAIYDNIVKLYYDHNKAQERLRSLRNAEDEISGLTQALNEARKGSDEWRTKYLRLQAQHN